MVAAIKYLSVLIVYLSITACLTTNVSVYSELGGQVKVEKIVDNFIAEIEFDPLMYEFFKDSDIDRFREKLIEHVCMLTNGPCNYTGDTMVKVHAGMNISEAEFNHGVDLFIKAMDKAKISHQIQNKVLAKLISTREGIIYH